MEIEKCQRCASLRLGFISVKTSGNNHGEVCGIEFDGDVPDGIGIGDDIFVGEEESEGDYIDFSWCLECGQIQGEFPLPKTKRFEDGKWHSRQNGLLF